MTDYLEMARKPLVHFTHYIVVNSIMSTSKTRLLIHALQGADSSEIIVSSREVKLFPTKKTIIPVGLKNPQSNISYVLDAIIRTLGDCNCNIVPIELYRQREKIRSVVRNGNNTTTSSIVGANKEIVAQWLNEGKSLPEIANELNVGTKRFYYVLRNDYPELFNLSKRYNGSRKRNILKKLPLIKKYFNEGLSVYKVSGLVGVERKVLHKFIKDCPDLFSNWCSKLI